MAKPFLLLVGRKAPAASSKQAMLEQTATYVEQRVHSSPDSINAGVIQACKEGDREAFRLLFEAYKDRVFSIACYSLGDEAAADDITQQIFVKLFTRIGQFRGDSEFTTWLYRLVINSCLDERRKQKRFLPVEDFSVMSKAVFRKSPETRYERREIAGSVRDAIDGLKPRMRLPIMLKYIEGLSYEEIAEVLGCSKGTVASRLNRAHKALAKKLSYLRGELEL
ncbi:MAG: polymerase sigma-70 factor, subfamily [Blastocatellia bacterium]|nr:polymerase sigma-70 factor, subfamily [Blastocatellia bacterium]